MDHLPDRTDSISKLIFAPTLKYKPLNIAVLEMWNSTKSRLQFLNKIEQKTGEFLQYTITDIELLGDEIIVTKEDYNTFYDTLTELKSNLIHFEPQRYQGEFISVKNGIEYFLNYEYYYAYLDYMEATGYIFKIWERGKIADDYFSFQLRVMENGKRLSGSTRTNSRV